MIQKTNKGINLLAEIAKVKGWSYESWTGEYQLQSNNKRVGGKRSMIDSAPSLKNLIHPPEAEECGFGREPSRHEGNSNFLVGSFENFDAD